MRLIMAVSADGYVARGEQDHMQWLGHEDKALFRALTSVGGDCWVSRKSSHMMPINLAGRKLHRVSRQPGFIDLDTLRRLPSEDWLLGGQTLALLALSLTKYPLQEAPLVTEVHLCRSNRSAFPAPGEGIPDVITPLLLAHGQQYAMRTMFGHRDLTHEVYRLTDTLPQYEGLEALRAPSTYVEP
jgi:hypothetical protein